MMIVEECVHAYSSSYTSTAKDSTFYTLGMDTEVVDSSGFHDNATNNSRLTFPSGGVFLVFGGPQWYNPGGDCNYRLRKNGTSVGYEYESNGFAANPTALTGRTLFWLENFSSGDYMDSQVWCSSGGSADARTQMAALKVSDYSCMTAPTSSATATDPTAIILTFGTTVYDPQSMATASDRIECKKAGYYLVLSSMRGASITTIRKNGSSSDLKGSYAFGGAGEGRGADDYVVDWFEVGDYVRVNLYPPHTVTHRQFAMIYLGDASSVLSYAYTATDQSNTEPSFNGVMRCDTEWIDSGQGHPQNGFQYNVSPDWCTTCGKFNMLDGYHFGLAKVSTDGGTFLQNDGVACHLNGSQLGNVFSTNRHARGSKETALAFACFSAVYGDTFTGVWNASSTYAASNYSPYANVFVTDASQWNSQIYRRITG